MNTRTASANGSATTWPRAMAGSRHSPPGLSAAAAVAPAGGRSKVPRMARFVCTIALLLSLISCQYAFAEVLILPSALREIGIEAFSGDTSLDEVVLPEGLERIGAAAFKGSSVRRIYLPASLSDIAPDAFEGCSDIAGYGPDETYASRYFDETEGLHFEREEDDCISIMIGTKVFEAELADNLFRMESLQFFRERPDMARQL